MRGRACGEQYKLCYSPNIIVMSRHSDKVRQRSRERFKHNSGLCQRVPNNVARPVGTKALWTRINRVAKRKTTGIL